MYIVLFCFFFNYKRTLYVTTATKEKKAGNLGIFPNLGNFFPSQYDSLTLGFLSQPHPWLLFFIVLLPQTVLSRDQSVAEGTS